MKVPLRIGEALPSNAQPLLRLLRDEVVPRRYSYLLAAACMAVVAALTSLSAWIMKDVINQIFFTHDVRMLWLLSALVAAIFVVKGFAVFGATVVMGRIGNSVTASLRRRFFDHLLLQELSFFTKANSSQFVGQVVRHVNALRSAVDLLVKSLAGDLLTLIGLVAVMVSQQPVLFCFAIPSALVVVWFVGVLSRRLGDIVRKEHQADVKLISMVQETAQGIRSVKAFNLSRTLLARFDVLLGQSEGRANRINRITALAAPLTESLGGLAIAGVILYGGWKNISSGEPPGGFMAFITALLLAYEPAKRLSKLRMKLEQYLALATNFYDFLDRKPVIDEPEEAVSLDCRSPARIQFHKVSFSYSKANGPVIRKLDLSLEPGRITALCGPTGGGKSTLVDLIFRFHDPQQGRITIGGNDLRRLSTASLRAFFAYVGQDIFLFDTSIEDNIRLGRENVSDELLVAAARAALLDEFVEQLPAGYDTPVGEKGVRLSGGQRQRVAIARALFTQAPVLVFDEATSALDPIAEKRVLENVRQLQPRSSLLIVSHRIAPLMIADQIVVLEHGRIVEQGPFQELVTAGGRFFRLFESQLSDGEGEPAAAPRVVASGTPDRDV